MPINGILYNSQWIVTLLVTSNTFLKFFMYVISISQFPSRPEGDQEEEKEGGNGKHHRDRGRGHCQSKGLSQWSKSDNVHVQRQPLKSPRLEPAGGPAGRPLTVFTRLLGVHAVRQPRAAKLAPNPAPQEPPGDGAPSNHQRSQSGITTRTAIALHHKTKPF